MEASRGQSTWNKGRFSIAMFDYPGGTDKNCSFNGEKNEIASGFCSTLFPDKAISRGYVGYTYIYCNIETCITTRCLEREREIDR